MNAKNFFHLSGLKFQENDFNLLKLMLIGKGEILAPELDEILVYWKPRSIQSGNKKVSFKLQPDGWATDKITSA